MNLIQAITLGIVQGLTEFLPISSTGHLILVPYIFKWQPHPLVFDTTLHLGTAAALVIYFYKDILKIAVSFIQDLSKHQLKIKKYNSESKLALMIIVGSLPAGILGFFFGDLIEEYFRSLLSVAIFVLSGAVIMFIAEKFHEVRHKELSYTKSFGVGVFQSFALLPGFSRSGATISGAMLFGMKREDAARFSFLLSIPIVIAAGVFQLKHSFAALQTIPLEYMLAGFIASVISGVLAIVFMLRFVRTHSLYPFIIYRILLFILVLYFFF